MKVLTRQRDYLEEALGIERQERKKTDGDIRRVREEKLALLSQFEKLRGECTEKDTYLIKLKNKV